MSTITTDLQLVSANATAENITGWTTIGATALTLSNAQDFDAKVQGIACLKVASTSTTMPTDAGLALNAFTGISLTNKLLFVWRNHAIPTNLPYKGQCGGNAVWISSNATYNGANNKIWDLTGSDSDQVGGWNSFAIDPTRTANTASGTLNIASITSLGFTRKYLTSMSSPFDFLDVIRYGTGLKVRDASAVAGQASSFEDFFTIDQSTSTAYGVLTKNNGIYNAVGKLIVGGWDQTWPTTVDSQQMLTYFQDNDETIVFKTLPVTTSTYEIRVATTGTYHTVFQLGNYDYVNSLASGDVTIRGNIDNGAMSSMHEQANRSLTTTTMFASTSTVPASSISTITRIAQSFICTAIGSKLRNARFYLSRTGTPTGSLVAKLYNASNSTATGIALATSTIVSTSTLAVFPAAGYITFNFTGVNQYTLQDGTIYCISLELVNNTSTSTNTVVAYSTASGTTMLGRLGSTSTNNSNVFNTTPGRTFIHRLYTINQPATWRLNAVNNPQIASTATTGNNIIKLYSAYLANTYSTVLNGNTRSITTGCIITENSNQLTTANVVTSWFTSSNIVTNMLITGYGIPPATYVTSIDDENVITMTNTATISVATTSLTFTDRSEVISSTWNSFGTITPNGCYITDSVFQNLNTSTLVNATHAMVINRPEELVNITNCKFINAGRAIRIATPGIYTLTNITFSGSTFDIDNASSGGQVVINAVSGSNPRTFTNSNTINPGTTVINIFRTFNVTNVISSSTVRIVRASDLTVLASVENVGPNFTITTGTSTSSYISVYADPINAGRYVMSYVYGYTVDIPAYIVVFALGYQALRPAYTLQNVDASYQAGQVIDRQYFNPGGQGG
jgi:hypothetical protein